MRLINFLLKGRAVAWEPWYVCGRMRQEDRLCLGIQDQFGQNVTKQTSDMECGPGSRSKGRMCTQGLHLMTNTREEVTKLSSY